MTPFFDYKMKLGHEILIEIRCLDRGNGGVGARNIFDGKIVSQILKIHIELLLVLLNKRGGGFCMLSRLLCSGHRFVVGFPLIEIYSQLIWLTIGFIQLRK